MTLYMHPTNLLTRHLRFQRIIIEVYPVIRSREINNTLLQQSAPFKPETEQTKLYGAYRLYVKRRPLDC